jgi:hypothetical protein
MVCLYSWYAELQIDHEFGAVMQAGWAMLQMRALLGIDGLSDRCSRRHTA